MKQQAITKSAEETQKFAEELASTLKCGGVLLLYGNLGAGKTTFMQGFARGLGIEQRIISPTFVIVRKYESSLSSRMDMRDLSEKNEISQEVRNDITSLYHIDLYRTESDADLESIGIQEILDDKNAVIAIEWPEKLGNFLPEKRIEILFETKSENEREITVSYV